MEGTAILIAIFYVNVDIHSVDTLLNGRMTVVMETVKIFIKMRNAVVQTLALREQGSSHYPPPTRL